MSNKYNTKLFEISKDSKKLNWKDLHKQFVKGTAFENIGSEDHNIKEEKYYLYYDQKPIGYFCLGRDKETMQNIGILFMAIDKKMRGCGIGKQIIDFSKDYVKNKGEKRLYLVTMEKLKNLINYYESLGFKYKNSYYHLWLKDGTQLPFSSKRTYNLQKDNIKNYFKFNRYFCDI